MTNLPRNLARRLAVAAACVGLAAIPARAATSLSQFGITWSFDRDYPTGQFANGDHWVVGPVTVTGISPRATTTNGVTLHGSMVNPAVNSTQGYDSRIKNNPYDSAQNVGLKLPLTLPPGTSLVSAESYTVLASGDSPQLKTVAILTILDTAAPAGAFRPPPVGTNKALLWNKSQLDYARLRSLPRPATAPALSTVAAQFERPWLEQKTNWTGRYLHADTNQPTYGRDLAHVLADGLLSLQLNYTEAEKETLLVRLVQYGLDVYGTARAGGVWGADGGHNMGRKMPLLLAGAVLGDANILAYADAGRKMIFQEDRQTWYVVQSDVGRILYTADGRPREQYIQADVGLPEWGEKHYQDPSRDGRNWNAYYRTVAGAPTIGHVLTAQLMGLKGTWNWPALFDYFDRFYPIEAPYSATSPNQIQPFVKEMWESYRYATQAPIDPETTAADSWVKASFAGQTGLFTVTFDAMVSGAGTYALAGVSQGAATSVNQLPAALRFSSAGFIDATHGSGFSAASTLPYTAGVSYRVMMIVDPSTRTYSATVTPPGGSAITVATHFAFAAGAAADALDAISFYATNGALSVTGVSAHAVTQPDPEPEPDPEPDPQPEPDPEPQPDPEPPPPIVENEVWRSIAIGDRSGSFTVTFDLTPSSEGVTGAIGLSYGPASAEKDLIALVALSSEGRFQAHNGSGYASDSKVTYTAGVTYRVTLSVDLGKKRYTATVQQHGTKNAIAIARNYQLPATPSKVNTLSYYSIDALLAVKNVSAK